MDELSPVMTKRLCSVRVASKFLSQPFFVAERFTGAKGTYVRLEDTIRSFKEILEGKHDHIPESHFYMKGSIDEVLNHNDT